MSAAVAEPIRRSVSYWQAADGSMRARRAWLPAAADRAVVLVHGFGEHCGRYEAMADWLARRGCAVHAFDHRGHGLSSGRRNFVRHFDEYVDDVERFASIVRDEHPLLARVLVGHSMGGLVCARMLSTREVDFSCAVLSGAALAVPPALSGGRRVAVRLLARIAPWLTFASGLPVSGLSRDPEVCRRYEEDPLVGTRMSVALAAAMLDAQRGIAGAGGRVRIALLGLHGAADPICSPHGTEAFMAEVRSPHSACRLYPGLRHEIFNEPEREEVWEDLLAWVRAVEQDARVQPAARTGGHDAEQQ